MVKILKKRLDLSRLLALIADQPYVMLLESSLQDGATGRYSILAWDPFLLVTGANGSGQVISFDAGKSHDFTGTVLEHTANVHRRFDSAVDAPLEGGGAIGFLSYDLGRELENIPQVAADDLKLPWLGMAFYDSLIIYDHLLGHAKLISTGLNSKNSVDAARKQNKMGVLEELIAGINQNDNELPVVPGKRKRACSPSSNFNRTAYMEAVSKVQEYILAGDIFQANLSQRFSIKRPFASDLDFYYRLRDHNPAPYSGYMAFDDFKIISSSPELFLRTTKGGNGHRLVETRPIKGTAKRSHHVFDDLRSASKLKASYKDIAEHIMIVDVERNDLGRVCLPGSVAVDKLGALESFASVHHLVSTVSGEMRSDRDCWDLIKASFPGGSITGAPKIRAMEIIEELEPTRRGPYTGAMGYVDFAGNANLNIMIRTTVIKGEYIYYQVGGGIVSDSDPEKEYQETLDKGEALVHALNATLD